MPLPRPRTALRAVLPTVFVSAVTFTVLPAPSHAVEATVSGAVPHTSGPAHAATGLPALEDDAVEALRRVTTASTRLDKARETRDRLVARVGDLRVQASAASATARRLSAQVDDSHGGLLLDAVTSFVTGSETHADRAVAAVDNERFALGLLGAAESALHEARLDLQRARKDVAAARAAADQVETRAAARRAARTAIEQSRPGRGYRPADRAQRRLDGRALAAWERYLVDVARTGVVPPEAEALTDPDNLVEPFEPVHDRRGRAVPGVAEVDTESGSLTVLSAETIRAVAATFRGLGREGLGTGAPDARAFRCGGLAAGSWAPTGLGVPDTAELQWDSLGPIPLDAAVPGDLVFTGAADGEPSSVGVVVGDGLVVTADSDVAAVRELDRQDQRAFLGARRPTLAEDDGLRLGKQRRPVCTEPVQAPAPGPAGAPVAGWSMPVPAGFAPTTPFGVAGPLWSSGSHTGLDFAAPVGTPVYAVRGGVVTVERPAWAGLLVRVDHGAGVESWYAHLSASDVVTGQVVSPGEALGAVGSAGNSTGPHLHLEVRRDGVPTDPAAVLGLGTSPAGGSRAVPAERPKA